MKKHEIILNIINKELEIDINEITRERKYVDGRSIFYWLCTHYTDLNFSQISKLLGKNHATVLHSIKNFPYLIEYDVELKDIFDFTVKLLQITFQLLGTNFWKPLT